MLSSDRKHLVNTAVSSQLCLLQQRRSASWPWAVLWLWGYTDHHPGFRSPNHLPFPFHTRQCRSALTSHTARTRVVIFVLSRDSHEMTWFITNAPSTVFTKDRHLIHISVGNFISWEVLSCKLGDNLFCFKLE